MTIPSASRRVGLAAGRRPADIDSQFALRTSQFQRGVALVITLILLSVTLVMAVAFLAIVGHQRGSVATQTDTTTTRLAADSGLSAAEAQIAANFLATTNPYNYGLLASTNYDTDDSLSNLVNLRILPRVPVTLSNLVSHTNENRFYLDLNRNGVDDPSGWVVDNSQKIPITYDVVGDPEWIGILQRPDLPYGPDNPFIARYAFIALPLGNALDLNFIHNQTLNQNLNLAQDGYFRNQGVGSWELNLAAFLADLNANEWGQIIGSPVWYQYNRTNLLTFNSGAAFSDAFALLTNRYAGNYNTLLPVGGNSPPGLFTNSAFFQPFQNNIDAYSDGPLQTTIGGINAGGQSVTIPWAGADNTNRFFDLTSDLFNPAKSSAQFVSHLSAAATNSSTIYDRYTFYRLLEQMGTDSQPDAGKMNLNYDNLDPAVTLVGGVLVTNPPSATNFMAWTPLAFFTNAADRMLKAYTAQWANTYVADGASGGILTNGVNPNFVKTFNVTNAFGITAIPVWVSNQFVYTPAVQRVLQQAANLYDATATNYYPSVFRPLFTTNITGGFVNVFITGYTNVPSVTGTGDWQLGPPLNASLLTAISSQPVFNLATNVYGVPWIIGVKKGFPNFNEFVQENIVGVTRRLQFMRDTNYEAVNYPKIRITRTNQMYIFSVNSSFGVDFWNSYASNFNDNVTVFCQGFTWMTITNDDPGFNGNPTSYPQPMSFGFGNVVNIGPAYPSARYWPGASPWGVPKPTGTGQPNLFSFDTPVYITGYPVLTNSVYRTAFASSGQGTLPPGVTGPSLIPTNYFGALGMPVLFETNTVGFPLPHFGLLSTNFLQVYILDQDPVASSTYHVIDYAHLVQGGSQDLNAAIFTDDNNGVWNASTNTIYGIKNQIDIGKGLRVGNNSSGVPNEDGGWQGDSEANVYYGNSQPPGQQAALQAFFQPYNASPGATVPGWGGYPQAGPVQNVQPILDAPYAPTRYAVTYLVCQANDPLVHFLASDMAMTSVINLGLADLPPNYNNSLSNVPPLTDTGPSGLNLGSLNKNYQPWGGNPTWNTPLQDTNALNLAERDPLVTTPDLWNFPTNKLPTTGWMGRVHRGTPWQTVYLKSPNILQQSGGAGFFNWFRWTGNSNPLDAVNAAPVADRLLFDLFTTAPNDNASRGTLPVNIGADNYDPVVNPDSGLAAWSALFSGMVVPTNSTGGYVVISPAGSAGVNSQLGIMVSNINATRLVFTNVDGLIGTFEHAGDVLSVPQLTDHSPFLNSTNGTVYNDQIYEWLPQQMMSLVRGNSAPRYAIYSFGQALKPAATPNGVFVNGSLLVTNYQVTAETATRAVVRFDNTVRTNDANGNLIVSPPKAVVESFNVLPPN